jgi:regulator of protease activity HflC (stomatin/prohibitin superfamily)
MLAQVLGTTAVCAFIVFIASIFTSFHTVNEGHVGIYYFGGAIVPGTSKPGVHFMVPYLSSYVQVPVGISTVKVDNVPCGTSGGVVLYFEYVEVVFRIVPQLAWETVKNYSKDFATTWVSDPVHHEVNQICSVHSLQDVFISKFSDLDEMYAERSSLKSFYCLLNQLSFSHDRFAGFLRRWLRSTASMPPVFTSSRCASPSPTFPMR